MDDTNYKWKFFILYCEIKNNATQKTAYVMNKCRFQFGFINR